MARYFGDGNVNTRYPLTVIDIVAHEIAHGFTAQYSDLLNTAESGAMDNAFSDLIGEVAQYLYYGSNDWRVGVFSYRAMTGNVGTRFMDNPPLDGASIDNYAQYTPDMSPYYASGIYAKAMYLLSNDITFSDGLCALHH